MVFVDASALISIIAGEADAAKLANILETVSVRLCSPLSVWETIAGLCRSYAFTAATARVHVNYFLDAGGFEFVDIGRQEFETAVDAYAKFGKGRHPAKLNMGDCYAYACARTNGAKLLYKGDDFSKTDIASAMV